jgi:hypothetical protein
MDLSCKYLGRHWIWAFSLAGPSSTCVYNFIGVIKIDICDPTPRNESLCAFEKSEKKGKVKKKKFFFSIHDVFCQNRPIAVPR